MAQGFGFIGVLEKQAHSAGYATVFLACLWSQKTSQTWVLLNPRSLAPHSLLSSPSSFSSNSPDVGSGASCRR